MSRPIIAIDIDDVLADNAAGFVAFSNKQWGTALTIDDYDEHWAKVWQTDWGETLRRRDVFIGSGVQNDYRHVDGAKSVLRQLSKRFDLYVVTARMIHTKDDTQAWIHKHYPGIFTDETIHFAGLWDNPDINTHKKTKADVLKQLGVKYLIDDQKKHCFGAAEQGITAVLFGDYKWNQSSGLPEGVVRCHTWEEVEEFFANR